MVSGALLFPVRASGREFVRRRLGRIVIPLVVWSAVALAVQVLAGKMEWMEALQSFVKLPLGCVRGFAHGWYLYVLVGIYLFIPVVGVWVSSASKRQLQYFIALWMIAMSFPYVIAVFGYVDTRVLAPFAGYIGYMILGYYLHRYPVRFCSVRQWSVAVLLFIVVAVVLPAIVYMTEIPGFDIYGQIIYNYQSISTVVMCMAVFVMIANYNPKWHWWNAVMKDLSIRSFGIYLVNFIILRQLFSPYFVENPMSCVFMEILVTFLGSLVLSWLVVWLLGFLPFRKYIIG